VNYNNKISGLAQKLGFDNYGSANAVSRELTQLVKDLKVGNYSREYLLSEFCQNFLRVRQPENGTLRIGVVGGSKDEPELKMLVKLGYLIELCVIGIEYDSNLFLDLNLKNSNQIGKFDLILCSQVLEHVWNIENSFFNLVSMLEVGGSLWLSCPASNRFHGSPEFFSAGYSELFLRKHLTNHGLNVLNAGTLGSHRNYVATHWLDTWLTRRGHSLPLFFAYENKPLLPRIALSIRFCFRALYLSFLSPRITHNPRFATETWAFARRDY
jgi:SAM-dependent methyltransferase